MTPPLAYQKPNMPGPEVGTAVTDPLVMANIIKKSSNILMVIGAKAVSETVGDKKYADVLFDIATKAKARIIASAEAYQYFADTGKADGLVNMPLLNITDRLRDAEWNNLDGTKDKYDLIIFGGFLIYYLSQALSTIKNFSEYRTISLDRYYHPNARFSLSNIEKEEWIKYMEAIVSKI